MGVVDHDKEGPYLRFYFEYMLEYARVEVTKIDCRHYGYQIGISVGNSDIKRRE